MSKRKLSLKEIGLPRLIFICLLGISLLILCMPNLFRSDRNAEEKNISSSSNPPLTEITEEVSDDDKTELEKKFTQMLSKVKGLGKVEVMITFKSSREQIVLKDSPYTEDSLIEDDGEGGKREEKNISKEENTILVTEGNGETMPYILQEIEPIIEGVFVVAEGGDNARLITEIVEAAEVLFRVPAHKVKVMKMK